MQNMDLAFKGRTALIIGGSGGIGSHVAHRLAVAGASLVIHGGHSTEGIERTLSSLQGAGAEAWGFIQDIRGPEAVATILEEVPAPDILVCSWGPFYRSSLEDTGPKEWESTCLLNLAFPGALVSAVLPSMIERGWGRILLFGGTCTDTIRGFSSTVAYSAAKTGLGVLVKSAAKQAGARGVTCNMICPGFVDTEYLSPESRSYATLHSPGGRLIQGEEIAEAAFALLNNKVMNGAIVNIDGGLSI